MVKRLIGVLAFCLLAAPPLFAQLTRGAISGTVNDSSGGVVAGAVVTVTNLDTNLVRTAATTPAGFYRIAALEPGRYRVTIELAGFTRVENRDLTVRTATEVTFHAQLRPSTLSETLDVTAEAPGVTLNKTSPVVGLTATERQVVELPLDANRDVNQLALLSANAVSAPGSTGISVNGQRARNNNFSIDGSDNNDVSVTLSTTDIPPEAVAEFQVQTNMYSAEFGRSSGAQINVTTKSGTNRFHGQAFEYYRAGGLNALNNLQKAQVPALTEPPRFIRHQTGGALGGPIQTNKTFFFGLVQRDSIRSSAAIGPTFTMPTAKGFADLQNVPLRAGQSQASRQAMLNSLAFLSDVYAQGPVFLNKGLKPLPVNGVNIEVDQAYMTRSAPSEYVFYMLRLDHQFSDKDRLTLRLTRYPQNDEAVTSNLQFGTRFSADQDIKDQNIALSETHSFSGRALNEFRFSYIRRDLDFPEVDPKTPTTGIGGMFTIGGSSNFPQGRIQDSFQFSNVFTYQTGRHTLKAGADIRYIRLDNRASFDSKGTFTFTNLQDFMNNTAAIFRQALQTASFVAKQSQQFYFAQDDFRVTPDLTVNLGLRYETSSVPFGFFGATDPTVRSYVVPGPVRRDTNNIAPRVGFNYSPRARSGLAGFLFGDGRSVIRAGYGRSFDVLFYNILTVNMNNYPRVVVGEQSNVVDVYPNLTTVSGAPVFNALTTTFVNTPEDAQNPEAHFFGLNFQRELGRDFQLEVGFNGSRTLHGIGQGQANPAILTAEQAARVRETKSATSIPSAQLRRLYPQYASRTLISTDAQSTYRAGYVTLNKRFSHGFQFGASYTYGRLISNGDESLAVAGIAATSPQIPQDYLDTGAEKSLSVFDRTHRFVIHYIWEVPWFKQRWAQNAVLKQIFSGWQLSGVTTAQSGQPFTIVTGVDSNGNGTATADRPNLVADGVLELDPVTGNFRTFKAPLVGGRFYVPLGTNGLPLANSLGNGNLGRNTYRAPGSWNTNLSLSKHFTIKGEHRLTLRLDALNAFNQDDYGIPNNNMNSAAFGTNANNWGARTLTLGARYSF